MTTLSEDSLVLEKNMKAAGMWSSTGRAYDEISRGISEGIRHCVMRLDPKPGQRIVDIATGTGMTARCISRSGAEVTGVDIADGLLEAARQLSEKEGLSIDWQLGDAEKLPFDEASFDAAASTFGIMFATDQDAAISELARVVRPGGLVAIAAWLPGSPVAALRAVIASFMLAPLSPPPSPFNWGDPDWLKDALGVHFELGYETGALTHRLLDAEEAWRVYEEGYGPLQVTSMALDDEKRAELKAAFIDWVSQYTTELGIAVPYQYLITMGIRR